MAGSYPWSFRSKGVFFVYIDIPRVMEMTAYEAIIIMLGALTLMMSIISIVIKLLLYITKIMQKNNYLEKFWRTLR